MEIFDELDERGEPTGRTVTRDEAHKNGIWHRAVCLFLVNGKRQVLMGRRSYTKKLWPGCWDVSSGGHVDAGETGLACAVREMYEELGIKIDPRDVRYIGGYCSNNKSEKMWDKHFNEFYIAHKDVDVADIKMQQGEIEEIKWIDFDEFKKLTQGRDSSLTTKWEAYDALIHYIEEMY